MPSKGGRHSSEAWSRASYRDCPQRSEGRHAPLYGCLWPHGGRLSCVTGGRDTIYQPGDLLVYVARRIADAIPALPLPSGASVTTPTPQEP
ncbi:protein of unknown function [Streptomyces murinus]